jgi:hypothetical protein
VPATPTLSAPIEAVPLRREASPLYRALLPGGHGATRAALLPIAWLTGGDLHPAKRLPVNEVTFRDRWGQH